MNVNGVLYTAQAAGQQMEKFGNGGSIILIASMAGSIALQVNQNRHIFNQPCLSNDGLDPGSPLGELPFVKISGIANGPEHGM